MSRPSSAIFVRGLVLGTMLAALWSQEARADYVIVVVEDDDVAIRDRITKAARDVLEKAKWEVLTDTTKNEFIRVGKCISNKQIDSKCMQRALGLAAIDQLLHFQVRRDGDTLQVIATLVNGTTGALKLDQRKCMQCKKDADLDKAIAQVTAAIIGFKLVEEPTTPTQIQIETVPPGATISIDGKPVGESGKPYEVAEGKHTVKVTKPGHIPQQLSVEVARGQTESLRITLLSEGSVGGSSGRSYGVLKWVAIGTGVVAVATGVGLIAIDGPIIEDNIRQEKQYETLAGGIASTVGGAALIGAGVYMLLTEKPAEQDKLGAEKQIGLRVWGSGLGVGISGSF